MIRFMVRRNGGIETADLFSMYHAELKPVHPVLNESSSNVSTAYIKTQERQIFPFGALAT